MSVKNHDAQAEQSRRFKSLKVEFAGFYVAVCKYISFEKEKEEYKVFNRMRRHSTTLNVYNFFAICTYLPREMWKQNCSVSKVSAAVHLGNCSEECLCYHRKSLLEKLFLRQVYF